jgi:hypothetical protein
MGERVDAVAAVFQALLARRCSEKGWSRVRVLLRVLRVSAASCALRGYAHGELGGRPTMQAPAQDRAQAQAQDQDQDQERESVAGLSGCHACCHLLKPS